MTTTSSTDPSHSQGQLVLKWGVRGVVGVGVAWLALSAVLIGAVIWYGTRDFSQPADVIVVLGAGVNGDGSPSQTLVERAEVGASLWREGVAPQIICTGGIVGASPRQEADACLEVLTGVGIPADVVILEVDSINTQTNALNTAAIMQQRGMTTAVVVSSRYHLLRARWLFWRVGLPVHTSPAPIGHMTTGEILFSYTREWAAFHYQVLRDLFGTPHIYVPVP